MMTDLIVTLPHVFAVLVVVGWFVRVRRTREADPGDDSDRSGGIRTLPPRPHLPLTGRRRRDDLARSA
jgi:hypothetical protein